jgi:foldase protein PrsA
MSPNLRIVAMLACIVLASLPLHAATDEPDKVVVQHILIGFKKSVPDQTLERTRKEARALAEQLLRRAQEGEDFDALVKEYTNDQYPGKLLLTNKKVPAVKDGRTRDQVTAKFGDVAFRLEVGEVAMASHHAALSPFGYHIIKRLE